MTIGASGVRQPVEKNRKREGEREKKSTITTLLGKSKIIKFTYEFKISM